jgi:hypothetical protein
LSLQNKETKLDGFATGNVVMMCDCFVLYSALGIHRKTLLLIMMLRAIIATNSVMFMPYLRLRISIHSFPGGKVAGA